MHADAILRLLPGVYAETWGESPPLQTMLATMEYNHDEPEQIVAEIDRFFRPSATPDHYLPALASWVDLDWLFTGEQRAGRELYGPGTAALRGLIAAASELSSVRGTAHGLISFLETATAATGFAIDTPRDRPFHVVVTAPDQAWPHRELIERIVAEQKPVCSTHEVIWSEAAVAAVETEAPPPPVTSDPPPPLPPPPDPPPPPVRDAQHEPTDLTPEIPPATTTERAITDDR